MDSPQGPVAGGGTRRPRPMLDAQEGTVPMKTIRVVLSVLMLLSLTAVGFAADTLRPAETPPTAPPVSDECVGGSVGGLRMPGLYMGRDGVMHHVPKMQSCSTKIW